MKAGTHYWQEIAAEQGVAFSFRTADCLDREGIRDVETLLKTDTRELARIYNIGVVSMAEVIDFRAAVRCGDMGKTLAAFTDTQLLDELAKRLAEARARIAA